MLVGAKCIIGKTVPDADPFIPLCVALRVREVPTINTIFSSRSSDPRI